MKKDIIIAVISASLGVASTLGVDYIKANFMKSEDPLAKGVTELTHISKELILEQKVLEWPH